MDEVWPDDLRDLLRRVNEVRGLSEREEAPTAVASGDAEALLGTLLGVPAIPPAWLEHLELRDEIETVADDLFTLFRPDQAWWTRYPGW